MAKQWDGTEFFQMMADNEKVAGAFYRQLAADTKMGGKFFERLAGDEDRHFQIYTALLKKFAGSKGLTVEVSDEQEEYLNLMVKNNTMRDPEKLLQRVAKIKTKDEIYAIAENAERDAVLFVEELMRLYPKVEREEFEIVLREEKNHLKMVMAHRVESQLDTLRL